MWELVIIYSDGGEDVFRYEDRDEAVERGKGFVMALGNQVKWWTVRRGKWLL